MIGRRPVGRIPGSLRRTRRRLVILAGLALLAPRASAQLPRRLSDADFWSLFTRLSEPNGFWNSDNLLSNEGAYQRVIPMLLDRADTGRVYLGVGPEQNFTYIAALHPRMAFVLDIRRGNALELLMYKALFELSADRADFIARLFARHRPAGLDSATTATGLFAAFDTVAPDSALYRSTLRQILWQLIRVHHFALSTDDRRVISAIYSVFFSRGPALDYNNMNAATAPYGFYRRGWRPTYEALMESDDGRGHQRSFLASEASYRAVRGLELANLVVPVVGDFAGPKALRAIGAYVRARGSTIGVFYTSNVEQYLFGDGTWRRFYSNVAALPLDARSTFVRAVFRSGMPALNLGPGESMTMLSSVDSVLFAIQAGRVLGYADVVALSQWATSVGIGASPGR